MKRESVFLSRLTVCQSGKLFGITKDKFNLKAQFVQLHNCERVLPEIGRREDDILIGFGIHKNHHIQCPFELPPIDDLPRHVKMRMFRMTAFIMKFAEVVISHLQSVCDRSVVDGLSDHLRRHGIDGSLLDSRLSGTRREGI